MVNKVPLLILALAVFLLDLGSARSTQFPPGWNGLAKTPPRGWRSWNAFGARVSQEIMTASIDAIVSKQWTVMGQKNVSLKDCGYISVGVDEGWEGCGQGVNGTQHDDQGNPVINSKFPNMSQLVSYGHENGLKVGFYENGCACGERKAIMQNYQGDVRMLDQFGFDGVKLDGCGAQRNMTLYAQLMQSTGKTYLIENCHWGRCNGGDDSSCPTVDWCPMNWYRTSGDINSSPMSWYGNLQTTISFQDAQKPLSVPGCWAYPDMLEVGRIQVDGVMHKAWNRAHFGAWCVVSAPLILGLDVTQSILLEPIIDIITNQEAIAVNQAWAGHPGRLIWSGLGGAQGFPAARACDPDNAGLRQRGWKLAPIGGANADANQVALVAPGNGCLAVKGAGYPGGAGGLIITTCNSSDPSQNFEYDLSTLQLSQPRSGHCVDVHSGGPIVWMYGCTAGPNDRLYFNDSTKTLSVAVGAGLCFGVEPADPAGATFESTIQAWAKPLRDSVALLMINPDTKGHDFEVPLSLLPLMGNGKNISNLGSVAVRDIWAHQDLPLISGGRANYTVTIEGLDSVFVRLSAVSV